MKESKWFQMNNFLEIPNDILIYSASLRNIELDKQIIEREGIDINAKDKVYFNIMIL